MYGECVLEQSAKDTVDSSFIYIHNILNVIPTYKKHWACSSIIVGVTKGLRMRTEDGSSESYAQVTKIMASLAGVLIKDGAYFYSTQLASVSCSLEGKHEWSSTYFPIRLRRVFKDTFTLTLTSVLAQNHTPLKR